MSFLSVNHLISDRADHNADTFILGVPNKSFDIHSYTVRELDLGATLLAHHYASVGVPSRARGDATTQHTVALLAPSNFDYAVNELALCRMGLATLFLSINNSADAIAHLVKETGATHLVLHSAYSKVAIEALALLGPEVSCTTVPMADAEVYGREAMARSPRASWTYPLTWEAESRTTAFIVHSSGSTGFPKPISLSHQSMAASGQSFDTSVFVTLPLYHYTGHSCFWRALHLAKPVYIFPASDLPLTPSNVLAVLERCEPEAFFAVPFLLKQLAESLEGIARLRQFATCFFAGSALADEVGDKLVAEGVNLVTFYGSTETGAMMTSARDFATDKEWAYTRISQSFAPYCRLEEQEGGKYELVCLDGWPKKVVANRPDGSYATKDVFERHPTIQNAIKFTGRIDDTIVLTNGEKVAPNQMEETLKSHPHVKDAIVFGVARSQTGALVVLSEHVDSSSSQSELLAIIGPTLAAANSAAPSHAEIVPEMVVFLPHDTSVPKADKGSIIRAKVYDAFQDYIDRAYKLLEGNDGRSDSERVHVGSASDMEAYLLALVARDGVDVDTDLFSAGIDSLQAGRIRSSIQRDFNLGGKKLATNLVFDFPTVRKLAEYIVAFAAGNAIVTLSAREQMLAFVAKYGRFKVPTTAFTPTPRDGTVVVLTGATGSLGSQLLATLLQKDAVRKVYTLVRARDDLEATERVAKVMSGSADSRVIALASDFSKDRLGLSQERYDELVHGVTLVLHNAWSVNFNLNISSFEPHIRGVHNLINLCLESAHLADFYFASSISAVGAWPGPGNVPERVTRDTSVALDMGYGQSKWVAEKLCELASQTTPVRAVVLRIGQMVGSSVDGKWNETEAVSLMIKSAQTIHTLPALQGSVSWLPVDYAARIICELAELPAPARGTSQCWHIVQAKTVAWSDILSSLRASGLKFDIVPPLEWLDRLRSGPQDPTVNPTTKLLSYYESEYDPEAANKPQWRPLDTTHTSAASKSFREAPYPDDALVGKFVAAWRTTEFLA